MTTAPLRFALVALAVAATPALAQTAPMTQAALAPPLLLQDQSFFDRDTPATKRHKLAQAVALRTEVLQLQAADGGTLSPEHVAYVRVRAAVIRNGDRAPPIGSLIAAR